MPQATPRDVCDSSSCFSDVPDSSSAFSDLAWITADNCAAALRYSSVVVIGQLLPHPKIAVPLRNIISPAGAQPCSMLQSLLRC